MGERPKFNEEHQKNEGHCERERERELTEARLLLLIEAAVFEGHSGG